MSEETPVADEAAVEAPAVALPDDQVLAALAGQFPDAVFEPGIGHDIARVAPGSITEFVDAAREAGFEMFLDLTAVDHLHRRPQRYEVVVNLVDPTRPSRLLIKVALDGPDPGIPSITSVFPGANFFEREAFDLFGVHFEGHPELTRILLPDEWEGHPLRKDAPVGSVPVQFKEPDGR